MFAKECRDLEDASLFKKAQQEIVNFAILDNYLMDQVISSSFSQDVNADDLLQPHELVFFLRKISKELEFLLDLPFVKFWATLVKFPQLMEFLDEWLMNVRKYNDAEKIQIDLNQTFESSRVISAAQDVQTMCKLYMNRSLRATFKIFYRLSQNMEGSHEYFSMDFYRSLLRENNFFDMAKLMDLAAIYGQSNPKLVRQLIEIVIETEPRYLDEF
jgi:hypothetical protein